MFFKTTPLNGGLADMAAIVRTVILDTLKLV
jgi:hypothetical protein